MKLKLTLLLLLVTLFNTSSFCQSEKNDPSMEHTYWNFIRAKILPPNAKAYRFEKDIRIKLKGNFNKEDSACIEQLLKKVKPLVYTVNIYLCDSNPNITLWNREETGVREIHNFYGLKKYGTIRSQEYQFSFDNFSQVARNKNLKYYFIRSLTKKQHNPQGDSGIAQSIFQEDNPLKSQFTEVDQFLIKKLYSKDLYDQFKDNFYGSTKDYYYYRFGNRIKFMTEAIAIILGFISLLLLLKFKIIKTDSKNFVAFTKQGFLIINFILFFYLLSQSFSTYQYLSWDNILKIILIAEALLILELTLVFQIEKIFSNSSIFIKLITQSITTLIFTYTLFIGYSHIITLTLSHKIYWNWDLSFDQMTIIIMAVCFRLIFNFANFKNIQEIRLRDIELSQLKLLKSKAELQALHSRINPHFLYNSLNSIATLAHISPSKTEQMALSLSDFFRYAINHKDQDMIEIEKEVDITRTYLQIEKIRFGDDFDYSIEIDEFAEKTLIPRFLIQPLIENAVKHGISVIPEKGTIKLEISKQENHLYIKVFDNGPDFPDSPISGYGLQSLYEKLEIIYGESAKISWKNKPNKNICISVPLKPKSI